jgi:hypothetical protein
MKISKTVFLIILTFSISFFSCKPTEEESGITNFNITDQDISGFDEVISSIEFIPLKNNNESYVNLNCSVWNLTVTENYFVYSTICNPEAKIHLFDLKGNYIKSLSKNGNGPEEYQVIQGTDLSHDTLSITVGVGKIKQYHFPNFDYIGTISLDEGAVFLPNFTKISQDKWLTSPIYDGNLDENGEFNIFKIMDSSTGQTSGLPIKATPIASEIGEGEFEKLGSSFLLNFAFSDTLYLYKNGQTSPYATLDFGDRKPKKEDLKMDGAMLEATVANQPFVINMGKIWQTDSISRIKTFALAKNPNMDISNMRTFPIHEVFLNHNTKQVIAFQSLAGWSSGKGDAQNGYFYDILRADDWIYALENGLLGKYGEQLENTIKELGDFKDPILIKYQVKMK